MEDIFSPGTYPPRTFLPCDDCNLSFFCSSEHTRSGRHMHSQVPYEDGLDGLSQCQMNRDVLLDYAFAEDMFTDTPEVRYHYQPGPVKDAWESLIDQTWRGEYLPPIKEANPDAEKERLLTMLRYSSDVLTLSMTILFALEKLNPGDDSWTKRDTLTVHVS